MKMPDGGFRPAFHVQLAPTTAGGILAGVAVPNQGSASGALTPLVEPLERRYGVTPQEVLAVGGFAAVADIPNRQAAHPVEGFAPVKDEAKQRAAGRDRFVPKRAAPEGVAQWRQRMGTEVAQPIYRERARTAAWANAGRRNRGLYQFWVGGRATARGVVLWYAVASNLLQAARRRSRSERPPPLGCGPGADGRDDRPAFRPSTCLKRERNRPNGRLIHYLGGCRLLANRGTTGGRWRLTRTDAGCRLAIGR
jgi:hypothetical protein